ncbi:MAG: hypothetical protein GXP24_08495 [Planctomycetes bacterium]|nr:hypothetical protein [Planctomycetota bacterium]
MSDHEPANEDDELELEPVDPSILKHRQERTKRQTREAEDAFDINAAYDDQDDPEDPIDLEQLKKFRFTTRHLLIVTALLAIVMTMRERLGGCMGLFVSGCIALGAGWWFVLREEGRRLEKIAASREKIAQRLAARRAVEDGDPLPTSTSKSKAKDFDSEGDEQLDADWQRENETQSAFRFDFSMKELLVTLTVAASILGITTILGSGNVVLLLGLVALAGLLVQAFGVELPPLVVLGWWMLLVLYILLSLWGAFSAAPDPV